MRCELKSVICRIFRTWNATDNYLTGQIVKHNGGLWDALKDNTNVEPGTDPATWHALGQYDSLVAKINANEQELAAQALALQQTQTKVTNNEGWITARTTQIDLLQSIINNPNQGPSGLAQAIRAIETNVATDGTNIAANANSITALETKVDNNRASVSTEIATEVQKVDDRVTSFAGRVTTVEAKTGGANLLPDSRFETEGESWTVYSAPGANWNIKTPTTTPENGISPLKSDGSEVTIAFFTTGPQGSDKSKYCSNYVEAYPGCYRKKLLFFCLRRSR